MRWLFRRPSLSRALATLGLLALLTGLASCSRTGGRPGPAEPAAPSRPRLAVLVVVDQLRGDYLERWQALFGEGGFRRLMTEGAWFQNCHYPYAHTVTGAGHASVAAGCSPDRHGIVGNEWYDRALGDEVYCATSDRYQPVPPPRVTQKKAPAGGSPDRLLAPTLGDALKEATGGRGRVVSLSFKDRSAILPAGRRPDACYWLESKSDRFVTSSYYRDRPHAWVEELNQEHPANRWFGKPWERLRPDLDYVAYSGPDDVAGEGKGTGQGRTFPHPMTGGKEELSPAYYEALYNSPFGNELLLQLVKRAVEAERLGAGEAPDLLCVAFSSNDPVGHCWGPDSQEVLDTTLRTDLVLRDLLDFLDAQVGKGNYTLALTADHGVCPLPEVARAKGLDAARLSPVILGLRAEAFLAGRFGKPGEGKGRWLESVSGMWVYLNQALIRDRGLQPAEVESALADWLEQQTGIQTAYTRTELLGDLPADDPLGRRVGASFHPDRCGDVGVILKPYHLIGSSLTGTNHGMPHPYDTHVPLLVYGPGVRAGARPDAVTPQAAAVVLARALDIPPPAAAEAAVPAGLFE